MSIEFNNCIPIYLQIIKYLKIDIISGKYKAGDKILSVRDLAEEFKVNPNTIQKALSELENEKLIYTERTNGKYITNDDKLIQKIKIEYAKELTDIYVKNMKNIGYTKSEIKDIIGGSDGIKN